MNETLTIASALATGVWLGAFFLAAFGGRFAKVLHPNIRHFGSSAVCCCE